MFLMFMSTLLAPGLDERLLGDLPPLLGRALHLLEEGHHLLHGGPLRGRRVHAEDGDPQRLQHLLDQLVRHAAQLRVQDVHRWLVAPHLLLRPLHDVEGVAHHRLHRAPPAQDLQEHHPVAVHVALLGDLRGVAIL
ncbi:Os06g0589900 [Oryza sativa Japonica Group]|uniref:Os06g0589900 protein n=1 Tax=Oryza sativa subsp. japonica TaxID=39947 RepID=A0A0P0WY95_ORYSJ|nr:hypothetical protein EE612_035054 [Oryza sativa]BAS98413.1 Os06g0589900 [Oryza sativa Japonica Group]